ncbi:putative DNA binding domain-containing protein, partial [bacterium]|nr:putative DNA binding domain-containing protein [bacterium]
LDDLISRGEGQTLEFKLKVTPETGRDICAFANTNTGMLIIGLSDGGEIIGSSVKWEEQIASIANSCDPAIYPVIDKIKIDDRLILIVKVEKTGNIHGFKGKVFIRVGSTNRALSINEIIDLGQKIGRIQFDSEICPQATLKDINWEKVSWFRTTYKFFTGKEILITDTNLLKNLGCFKEDGVTNGGILLFGQNPEKLISQNQITIVRYPGKDVSDKYLDMKDFYGNLFDLIDAADEYIRTHIQIVSTLIPGRIAREEIPQYPFFAIRELVVNAVAHRDYSLTGGRIIIKMFKDRIEFYSPGGFPDGVTEENIMERQYSRNSMVVRILNSIKYIEAIGDGVRRVVDSIEKHPLKPRLPSFREVGESVKVTLFSADMDELSALDLELNEKERKIIQSLKEKGKIVSSDITRMFDVSRDTANRYLNHLIRLGIVGREGVGRGVRYRLE